VQASEVRPRYLLLATICGMLDPMDPITAGRAQSLRAFNRFYTHRIGVIGERVLDSPYSLAETRVLWELAHRAGRTGATATLLAQTLALDAGYLSRMLAGLRRRGLVKAAADPADRRRQQLSLSAAGRRALAPLERRAQQQMSALLAPLSESQQRDLLGATERIGRLLGHTPPADTPALHAADAPASHAAAAPAPHATALTLRPPATGDIGWVIARHGALYGQEYGWDWRFEALVARIAADFIERFEATREACWIAQRGGERLGCVFLVQARDEASGAIDPGTAQLRMLLVEPAARGMGLGRRLVDECERFARERGYRRIRLWTNSVLLAARAIYKNVGYRLVARERHASFGKKMTGETWELEL
jgi:DNA-binding MarR family transcriptional regulator/GNAT superfamily N-acetyltransferase